MTQQVRRRIEQPSEEQAKRSGCLIWGGVLGVLVGIMVGVYALPPILRHYYGETKVAADEFYRGDGKAIRISNLGQASEPLGEAAAGMRREDYFVTVVVVSEDEWQPKVTDFSLEFDELDQWRQAADATSNGEPFTTVPAATETEIELHFVVEFPPEEADTLTPKALHLSDPRVRFAIE
ncbi:MAG: hypothetical protein AB7N24_21820 [Dehalococcoidia bacterium]